MSIIAICKTNIESISLCIECIHGSLASHGKCMVVWITFGVSWAVFNNGCDYNCYILHRLTLDMYIMQLILMFNE